MTSRRPMTRSFSANGRTSSFNDEDGNSSNGRRERSNSYLSNVRPENRSTLCTVMAQLTEDVQPSFETTLKSKAVSENCNVKFSCVVSGTPAPELKWYKDDTEMDRYCGLPKYEIRRNGKTHTLQIYNCTLDDAAIYQVSASNSKGIVSCSGVLEVGTMNEFKIHQRFFEKLKQKAEKKKKDLDAQTKKQDKENTPAERPPQSSPERPPRKRHMQPPQENLVVKKPDDAEQMGAAAEVNGVTAETTPVPSTGSDLKMDISPPSDPLAKKKIKISNGVDAGVGGATSSSSNNGKSQVTGNGSENHYDGGKGLAQFLAETLQSQAAEEKQSSPPLEKRLTDSTDSEREERGKPWTEDQDMVENREEVVVSEKVTEKEKSLESSPASVHRKHSLEAKHHSRAHKDHEHHNIQASISSVFHSVKDFLFGKTKKDSRDHRGSKEKELDRDPGQPETPPSSRLQPQRTPDVHRPLVESIVPMEPNDPEAPSDSTDKVQQLASLTVTHKHKQEDLFPHKEVPTARKQPPELVEKLTEQEVKEAEELVEAMEVEPESSSLGQDTSLIQPRVHSEIKDIYSQADSAVQHVPPKLKDPDCSDASVLSEIKAADEVRHPLVASITTSEEDTVLLQGLISESESDNPDRAPTETVCQEEPTLYKMEEEEGRTAKEERNSFNELCGAKKDEVQIREEPYKVTSEFTELSFLVEKIEPCGIKTPDQVLPPSAVSEDTIEKGVAVEESEGAAMVQEMMVELAHTAASLEKINLKSEREGTEETVRAQNLSAEQSSSSGLVVGEDRSDVEVEISPALEEGLQVETLCKTEEQTVLEGEKEEGKNEDSQTETETERKVEEIEMLEDTEIPPVMSILNELRSEVSEEPGQSARSDNSQTQLQWPSEKIPQIQISVVDDSTHFSTPDLSNYERFIIPKIEILEPEHKECSVVESEIPKPELEHDRTDLSSELIMEERSVSDSPGLPPSDTGMQGEDNLSPTKVVKEPNQEVKMQDEGKSIELPQMEYTSLPVINISCSDDTNSALPVNGHDPLSPSQPLQAPTVSLFVVPPISVTCHESDPALQFHTKRAEWAETETVSFIQREIKQDVGGSVTVRPEKSRKQNIEEEAQKSVKEDLLPETPKVVLPKVTDNVPSFNKTSDDVIVVPDLTMKVKPLKDPKSETFVSVEDLQRNRSSVDRLSSKPPAHPSLSPASLRRFMSKTLSDLDGDTVTGDKADEDLSGGSTPTTSLSCENSPRMKRRDSLTLIRSATPEELASGARRKIFIPKAKDDGDGAVDAQGKKDNPYMSPSQARRAALLQASKGPNTPPMERRSPLLNRRKATLEVPKATEEPIPKEEPVSKKEEKQAEKKPDPLKAPQVIRKIRGEPFPDASGHLKLWCQFFNVLSDSTIKWFKDEEEILEVKRSGGDETQVALAIVLASNQDCGVYGCTINNEYGTDTTDFLLSEDVLAEILLRDDLEVGEEIEMTPLLFPKGLVDSGIWAEKYFGRIMTEKVQMGEGYAHKTSRVRVIYGLDPVFDSGINCIIKIHNLIPYGTKQESNLAEKNLEITKHECKVQDMIREYCKIFAAEARVNENFGFSLEVIPRYLMYRPANSVPYASVEADLEGDFIQYCTIDPKGKLFTRTSSEVELKCSTFQHWIHQWTHGNLLVTRLEGVETRLTNIGVVTKSKGYQGLTEVGSPDVFEQFQTHHQCNYYCGLLGLRPLKSMESQSTKIKGSRSPLLNRKIGSSSPQTQRKGQSPQTTRKANSSPKVTRKIQELEDNKPETQNLKPAETVGALEMR